MLVNDIAFRLPEAKDHNSQPPGLQQILPIYVGRSQTPFLNSLIKITGPATRKSVLLTRSLCLGKILLHVAAQRETKMSSDKDIQSAHSVIPHLRTINKAAR